MTDVGMSSSEAQEARNFNILVVRPEVQVETALAALRLPTFSKSSPGMRSAVGRISNSSGESFTTTHLSASAHHWPNITGSAACTTTCSHPSSILGIYGRAGSTAAQGGSCRRTSSSSSRTRCRSNRLTRMNWTLSTASACSLSRPNLTRSASPASSASVASLMVESTSGPLLLCLEDPGEHPFASSQMSNDIVRGCIVRHSTIMTHFTPGRQLMARPDPARVSSVLAWVMRLRRQVLFLVVVASVLAVAAPSANGQTGPDSVKTTAQRAYRPVPNPANDPVKVSVSKVRPNPAHAESDEPVVYRNGCHVYTRAGTYAHFCIYGDKHAKTTMVLFGDSHVAQWFPAFDGAARLEHVKLLYITKTSCPAQDVSVRVWERDIPYGACDVWRNHALALIKKLKHVDLIVMGGYAHHQVTKRHTNIRLSGAARTKEWEAGTRRTVAAIHAVADHFVILRDTPLMRLKTANCILSTHGDNRACQTATAKATADSLWHAEQRVAAAYDNVGVLDMTSSFCTPSWCRPVTDSRVLRWRDRSHMSVTFARLLAPRMRWMIRRALAGQLTG